MITSSHYMHHTYAQDTLLQLYEEAILELWFGFGLGNKMSWYVLGNAHDLNWNKYITMQTYKSCCQVTCITS